MLDLLLMRPVELARHPMLQLILLMVIRPRFIRSIKYDRRTCNRFECGIASESSQAGAREAGAGLLSYHRRPYERA